MERGVVVTNARGVFSRPIAEYVLMMILSVSRRLPQLLELQRERTWQPLEGTELRDVTVGIVGLGSIGKSVAELATAFGCRVVAVRRRSDAGAPTSRPDDAGGPAAEMRLDRVGGPETLPELLAESDFIVLAAPLTPETEDMIPNGNLDSRDEKYFEYTIDLGSPPGTGYAVDALGALFGYALIGAGAL
jgi:phosphoglycerate dehydrogenase-like enzyme